METMLSSGNVMETLVELKKRDRTLWQKIMDFFKDFANHLKELVSAYQDASPESVEGNLVADMKEVIGQLENLFTDALYDASENYQTIESGSSASADKIKYSERDFSDQVDAVLSGEDTTSTHLKVMDTPKILIDCGLPDLPVLLTAKQFLEQ